MIARTLRKVKLERRATQLPADPGSGVRMASAGCTALPKKVFKRGAERTAHVRHNMAYDGAIFDLHWKSVKIDRRRYSRFAT
jgi:hypothetical protein